MASDGPQAQYAAGKAAAPEEAEEGTDTAAAAEEDNNSGNLRPSETKHTVAAPVPPPQQEDRGVPPEQNKPWGRFPARDIASVLPAIDYSERNPLDTEQGNRRLSRRGSETSGSHSQSPSTCTRN